MRDILSRDLKIATNTTMPPAKATVNGHKQTLIKSLETLSTKAHIEGGVASIHRAAEKVNSRKLATVRRKLQTSQKERNKSRGKYSAFASCTSRPSLQIFYETENRRV